jgi:hypothetical protein
MEKLSRYVPHIALLAIVLLLWMFVYSNTRLNEAIQRLDAAEFKTQETLRILSSSRATIDSVQKDLTVFGIYVKDIQGRVEIMDLAQRVEDDQFRSQRSKIKGRLKELYRDVENTGQDLPEIPVVDIGKH